MMIDCHNRELIDASAFSLHDYVVSELLFENESVKMNVEYVEKRISPSVCIRKRRRIAFLGVDRFEFIFSSERGRSDEIFGMECVDDENVEQKMTLKLVFSNESYMCIRCQKVSFETISNATENAF